MRMRALAGVATLLLVVTGCGASDEEQAKEAMAKSIMEESDDTFKVKQSEADCIAAGMVDGIGVDQLEEYGILTEGETNDKAITDIKMSADDAETAAGAFVDCVDLQELMTDSIGTEGMDPAVADCMTEAFDDDAMKDLLAATFAGEDPATAVPDLTQAMQECMLG